MKELSIEQKAQRYDKAIEKAGGRYNEEYTSTLERSTLAYVFPELKESKESEDEKIRKAIHIYLDWLDGRKDYAPKGEYTIRDMIAWVEKQGEHANFRNKIEIGDKVTRNEDGVLVNLSQLNRVAKKDEKQIKKNLQDNSFRRMFEQKPAWSEEDERMFDAVIADIQFTQKAHNHEVNQIVYEREIDWLKSLKDRYIWKPSEEQIKVLEFFIPYVTKCNVVLQKSKDTLLSLLTDLKKLKEE